MAPIATADLSDYYPAPFPDNVPVIDLEKISIKDLIDGDEVAAKNLFRILSNSGFFYLDLSTDRRGQDFNEAANTLHNAAKEVFNNVSIEDKEAWKGDPLNGVLDRGYRAMGKNAAREPNRSEVLNVPSNDLLHDDTSSLPQWLEPYRDAYRSFAKSGNDVGEAIFRNLERELHLKVGELTDMFRLSSSTGGFVRIFRYLAQSGSYDTAIPTGPAHTDGNALTMLFNWQGGLQIVRPKFDGGRGVKMIDGANAEDEWLWLKPIPGHVIVNLGDPMVILTNGVLTSGRHRVMTPPGDQAKFHRYSVLMGMRPIQSTPMRPLKNDVIPPESKEERSKEVPTAIDWAVAKVRSIMERATNNQG